jgi:hypothetical protein
VQALFPSEAIVRRLKKLELLTRSEKSSERSACGICMKKHMVLAEFEDANESMPLVTSTYSEAPRLIPKEFRYEKPDWQT